jgi:hypothetical protein
MTFNAQTAKVLPLSMGTPKRSVTMQRVTGTFTKDQIREYAQNKSNALKKVGFNGMIQVSIKYPRQWSNGDWTTMGNNVSLYDIYDDEYEPEEFTELAFYYIKNAPGAMGEDDENNDCLFNCLQATFKNTQYKFKETPESFKFFLGLERRDPVPIELMPQVESMIPESMRINVRGDYIYTSTRNCTMELNLLMENGHCTLENKRLKVGGVSYEETPLLLYSYNQSKTEATCYDGSATTTVSREQITEWRNNFIHAPYTIICVDKEIAKSKKKEPFTMEGYFRKYQQAHILLKNASKGLINLKQTGTFKRTALNLFSLLAKHIEPEKIEQDEAIWIENAKMGALRYGKTYKGEGHKSDFCSMYPSTMAHKQMYFPVKRGTFSIIASADGAFKLYGIYRCEITGNIDKRLFRTNSSGYYTHIDLHTAQRLGYTIKMTQDGKPNRLSWQRDQLLTGNQIFGTFVKTLFEFKHKKIPFAKEILNILWGSLSEMNKMTKTLDLTLKEQDFNLSENRSIKSIKQLTPDKFLVQYVSNGNLYQTNFARIAPFLLARGRFLVSKTITPFVEDIVYIHTDGFITKKRPNIQYGTDLGDIRNEGYCMECEVINANCRTPDELFIKE